MLVWTVALCQRAVKMFAGVRWWDKKPLPLSPRQHETVAIATTTFYAELIKSKALTSTKHKLHLSTSN